MVRDKGRRIASERAETINHHNGELLRKIPKITRLENCIMEIDTVRGVIRKIPKITRLENCIMEIDTVRGVISVSHGGRVKFQVSRIPLRRLALPSITVVAAPEVIK